ncbi:uncharacterized protein LOC116852122 [Odontomachus brunneus]|uniref:uncharacterized protein LOC116852122 n=1 Tax=Odontomachus brunneus TaxID=486640 RepID=UPI0013F22D9F|nr:uncharacterized protein LOC116852122 [Odontomachus brunneus]
MTSNAQLKWKIACLALVLICQMTRQAEGHPRADQVTRRPPMKRDLAKHQNISMNGTSVSPKPEQTTSRESHERSTLEGKFVFPSDDDSTSKIDVAGPPSCRGSTFCENVIHYPRNLVDLAIQENSSLKLLTSVDVINTVFDITHRIHTSDETPLCSSDEKVVYPQSAENINNEWLYVVNQENFKQGVRVEICSNEEQKCNVIDGFADNYQTICKQKYISRELVALGSNGKIHTDTFRFPASCCCHVKYTGGPTPRSAR